MESDLLLPVGAELSHGWFGNGYFANMSLLHGQYWCRPRDEMWLIYRDDGAGAFDDAMPCATAASSDASTTIAVQDLAPAYVDANSMLLLHFNGTDASTTVTDTSPTTKTVAAAGVFAIDDAQYKFGPTSGYFSSPADVLSVTDHADFALGAAWTIELWARLSETPTADIRFWRQYVDGTHIALFQYVYTTGQLRMLLRNNPLDSDLFSDLAVILVVGTWHHIAATFDGTTCRLFLDGTLVGSIVADYTVPDFAANPTVGYAGTFRGWLDEFAIFDTCKYTANFTAPTKPWGYDQTNIYQYRRLAVSPAGSTSSDASATINVEVDSSGSLVGPVGNPSLDLAATAIAAGKIRCVWNYDADNEPATPTGFKIYSSSDAGTTYALEGSDAYRAGAQRHSYTTAAKTDAEDYVIKVVTYRTIGTGDYELGDATSDTATADSTGPAAAATITVTATP